MKTTTDNRINYIDIAKALGMLAVIWGHIMLSGFSYYLVYAIDIPLFFFLSGMMFKNDKYPSIWSFIKSRAKSLLLPYLIFSVGSWFLWVGYSSLFKSDIESYTYPLFQTFIAQGSGGYMTHNVTLWFITCLFVVEVLYYFIAKTKDSVNITVCIICAVIGHFMLHNNLSFDFTKLPWNIEAAMSAIVFYAFGNLFVKQFGLKCLPDFSKNKKVVSWGLVVILTAIVVIIAPLNGHISLGSNSLGNSTVVFYILSFCGIASTLLFSTLIDKLCSRRLPILLWIGKNSFYFMATHVPIKGFIIIILAKFLNKTTDFVSNNLIFSGISFIITLIISSIAVIIVNKVVKMFKNRTA